MERLPPNIEVIKILLSTAAKTYNEITSGIPGTGNGTGGGGPVVTGGASGNYTPTSNSTPTATTATTATTANPATASTVATATTRSNITPLLNLTDEQKTAILTPTRIVTKQLYKFSKVVFNLPVQYTDIIHVDWSLTSGLIGPCCCSINEFNQQGITLNGNRYWKYINCTGANNSPLTDNGNILGEVPVINRSLNTATDYLPVVPMYPSIIETLTVSLFDDSGRELRQDSDWIIELILVKNVKSKLIDFEV